jgi:hypothetical protein
MSNRIRGKRLKGVAVYVPRIVYDAWLDNLSAKELAMAMMPPALEEIENIEPGDRRDFQILYMMMPSWWVSWYKELPKEDKFRFGRLVAKRLKSIGLIGSSI